MRISKAEAAVITVLNIIIVALVPVALFVPHSFWTGLFSRAQAESETVQTAPEPDKPTDAEPYLHEKYREPSAGKAQEISRETRLMGYGDDNVVKSYITDGGVFIFGNAAVKGLDFDSYGGFMCLVDSAGRIAKYEYFDGNITAVGVVGGGYGVAAGGKLYFVDNGGAAVQAGEALKSSGAPDDVVDIFAADGGIAVVSQPYSTTLVYTEYSVQATDGRIKWTSGRATQIDSGYTLKYFDCYDFGSTKVIAARAHSLPRYDSIVFYSFKPGGDAIERYYGGTTENIMRPYAVMPCPTGYFAIASKNGVATLVSIDYSFVSYHTYSLGFTFTDVRLFYIKGMYYACFDRPDGAITYEFDETLSRKRLGALDGLVLDCPVAGEKLEFIGEVPQASGGGANDIAVNIASPDTSVIASLDIKDARVSAAARTDGGIVLVLSSSGGGALSETSGGKDIYVILVQAD